MKKVILSIGLALTVFGIQKAKAAEALIVVTGTVEHMEAMENEATIKISGLNKLFFIKNLMAFSEVKLQAIMDSQENQKVLKLKVNESNQVIDVSL